MSYRQKRLEKISKKIGIKVSELANIIVYQHELNNLIPKKDQKKVNLDLDMESLKFVRKIAKAIKVSNDAVIGSALITYMEDEERKKKEKENEKLQAKQNTNK